MKLKLLYVGLLVAACGNDDTTSDGAKTTSGTARYLVAVSELPTCDADADGKVVYLDDDKTLYLCSENEWKALELASSDDTTTEPAGIASTMYCSGRIDSADAHGLSIDTFIYIRYRLSTYSNGDVYFHASIAGDSFQTSESDTLSGTQAGAANPSLSITHDFFGDANAGYWDLSVDPAAKTATAVYRDQGVSSSTATWTFDDCDVTDTSK